MSHPVDADTLMRYIDGELAAEQRLDVEEHARACSECARDIAVYTSIGSNLRSMDMETPGGSVWKEVSRRLAQPVGWALIVVGLLVYLAWGIYAWWTSPDALWEKLAGGAVVLGAILLLAGALIDRLVDLKTDPYRHVHR